MSFDKATRNALAKLVTECRRLLTDDIRDQLQRIYGLQPDGTALPVANLRHLDEPGLEIARELRGWQDHLVTTEHGTDQERCTAAFDRLAQETAFTALNRLAALRLCEERDHILECVRRGKESDGFALYEQLSGGALGTRGETYRHFLQRVFDELAEDLGVLFDRRQPHSLVFPGERCLEEVLALLNDPALRHIWQEDETIGWIYQYYNDPVERKKMRESGAPRNSRELAVRNQFFTPRYVVEFLTANTLGRIWYEMTKGDTSLKDKCLHLLRRPNEVFLNAGQDPPVKAKQEASSNKCQEELLKEPVYIPDRPLKDPREIRLLDPACGSMHFGLYAFDLFEIMYEEVWDNYPDLFADLLKTNTNKREFLILVPKLIIEHNLHGIEIDPRCTQIAGLSLWLRAQKTWQRLGLKLAERPQIARSNIVCAEPMPGEKELLREFTVRLENPAIGQVVELVFDRMQLAGEAGYLLKIEEEIRSIVAEAKALWKQGPKHEQLKLFYEDPGKPAQQELQLDLSGITDEQFWEKAEERIYSTLQDYAEQAQNGSGYQRRLFAADAAQGFAFIDVCRKRYDVVMMNPPFGESPDRAANIINTAFSSWGGNLAAAFVIAATHRLDPIGKAGIVADRTIVVKSTYQPFRKVLLPRMTHILDLGWNVLDANVEVTTFCLDQIEAWPEAFCLDLTASEQKDRDVLDSVQATCTGKDETQTFTICPTTLFERLPNSAIAYNFPNQIRRVFTFFKPLAMAGHRALQGHNLRMEKFARLAWEIPLEQLYYGEFVRMYKGGAYSLYYQPSYEVAVWKKDGSFLKGDSGTRWSNEQFQGKEGIGYGKRGDHLDAHIIPRGHIFTVEGLAVFPANHIQIWCLLGVLNSKICSLLLSYYSRQHKEAGYVGQLPLPDLSKDDHSIATIGSISQQCFSLKRAVDRHNELSTAFLCPLASPSFFRSAKNSIFTVIAAHVIEIKVQIANDTMRLDSLVGGIYGIASDDLSAFEFLATRPEDSLSVSLDCSSKGTIKREVAETLYSYLIGASLGRWNVEYATNRMPSPELPDPFASLPVCPPGMLQNLQGLPATAAGVPASYPLRISWPGILVDDPSHPEDIGRRVRESIEVIWQDRAEAIEHEACEILGVHLVRDYFNKPNGFFADHLKRYSKSRRQAPIYWPLSTSSGSYTVWVYYHRLNDDFLYKVGNDYVNPKLIEVERRLAQVETDLQRATGREATRLREVFEETQSFLADLQDFKAELLRVAALPYKPNLNDGVLITAAPLWQLFRLPKWRNDLKKCWDQLEAGDYDWAHLAYSIWPERVQEKCKSDRSLAIAHGLEHLCKTKPPAERLGPRRKRKAKAAAPEEF